jgi:hypothetical protein
MEFNENNINEAKNFLKEKVSGKVMNFNDFLFENEKDENGYGQQAFYFAENGDTDNYFFKLKDGQDIHGLVVSIGKFAKFSQPTEQKPNYGVLSILKLSDEDLDQAVVDQGKFKANTETIVAAEGFLGKLLKHLGIIIGDYVQKNPDVSKFYDEMQATLQAPDYDNKFAVSLADWPGGNEVWKLQSIEKGKLNLITK